jgi:hypothetical protein
MSNSGLSFFFLLLLLLLFNFFLRRLSADKVGNKRMVGVIIFYDTKTGVA